MSLDSSAECTVSSCSRPAMARGWCVLHYTRWWRHGDPLTRKPNNAPRDRGGCVIAGCSRPVKTREWCDPHYKRWLRWGDPLGSRPVASPDVRFWAKVDKSGPQPAALRHRGTCWQWLAGRISTGYGAFHINSRRRALAHRYSYELAHGHIPEGLVIDHLCRNRLCVNPDHMQPVTLAENTRRGLGVSTFNALKTHCPARHPYDSANTYISPRGSRICRACARERDRNRRRAA